LAVHSLIREVCEVYGTPMNGVCPASVFVNPRPHVEWCGGDIRRNPILCAAHDDDAPAVHRTAFTPVKTAISTFNLAERNTCRCEEGCCDWGFPGTIRGGGFTHTFLPDSESIVGPVIEEIAPPGQEGWLRRRRRRGGGSITTTWDSVPSLNSPIPASLLPEKLHAYPF